MTDEHEQRWTLTGCCMYSRLTTFWVDGPEIDEGERVEVVPAARLAEAEAERDSWRRVAERLEGEKIAARADLERAREALTRIAGWSRTGFCAETAQAALAVLDSERRTA